MAKFDLNAEVREMTKGAVIIEILDFEETEDGVKTAYNIRGANEEETNKNIKLVMEVDRQIFKYADKKVAKAICDILSSNKVKNKLGRPILDNFINRKGSYAKIRDKENLEIIKAGLKKLKGIELEALAYAVETLLEDSDFSEVLYESAMNHC